MATRPLRPHDPRWLGGYRLLGRLGEGGMGTVYLGRATDGRVVAVKAIRPEFADQEEFRARFRSEVNRVLQVPAFCTAAVLDADPDHETPYLIVEYVDGPSLQEVVRERGPMAPGDVHGVAVGVAAALTAIHGAGVIHRDLKPTNVLFSLGLPKVIDFGIARALEPTSRHTRTDQVMGTVSYMAPERLDATLGETTAAADVFAWGAVVTYAGTGRTPFGGDTPMATAARILAVPPDVHGLPEPLAGLVRHALSKDPRQRPTATELLQELLAAGVPSGVLPVPPAAPHRAPGGRHPLSDLLASGVSPEPRETAGPGGGGPVGPVDANGRFDSRQLLGELISAGPRPAAETAGGRRSAATTRRLLYAIVALLALTIGAAGVAYARTVGDPRPAAAPARVTATSAEALVAKGPSFTDPLTAPGRFRATAEETGGCTFGAQGLRARSAGGSTYQCQGPADSFSGTQTITVQVTLTSAGSCAMVWFRHRDLHGYELTACADSLELVAAGDGLPQSLGRVPSSVLQPGTRHEVAIGVTDDHATVSLDGDLALQAALSDSSLDSGGITLGVTGPAGAAVLFTGLDVR